MSLLLIDRNLYATNILFHGTVVVKFLDIAPSIDMLGNEFIATAIHLAQQPEELQVLRDLLSQRLRDRLQQQKYHLPLFDTDAWVRDFERAMEDCLRLSR